MKNFIFKSKLSNSDLYKIQIKLELIQREQRHARADLGHIIKLLETTLPDAPTLDEGFDEITTIKDGKITSHQTDLEEHGD